MKLSIIIPVLTLNEIEVKYFENALKSVENQTKLPDELLVVIPEELSEQTISLIPETLKPITNIIVNKESTKFQAQINLGVKNTKSDYFMYLEIDDEINKFWVENIHKYYEDNNSLDVLLPISVDVDATGKFIDITNQTVWAMDFCDDLGLLDEQALLRYHNFSIHGSAINTAKFNEIGGLKNNIELTYAYEFLLRAVYNGLKVTTIPRTAYKHIVGRENSLTDNYKKTLTQKDVIFWLEKAKKEYYFMVDRTITIEE